MKKLDEIRNAFSFQKPRLEKEYCVKEIGIFGSYARGEQNKKSDLDVLVDFSKPIGLFKFLELEGYLGELTGLKVDLVSKKALKRHIGKRILSEVAPV